jgi:hypothetical protein
MRRIIPCVGLGVLLTVLFVIGLATIRNWRGRAWSDDPAVRRQQVVVVIGLGAGVIFVMKLNSLLNPPRHESDDQPRYPKELKDLDL